MMKKEKDEKVCQYCQWLRKSPNRKFNCALGKHYGKLTMKTIQKLSCEHFKYGKSLDY